MNKSVSSRKSKLSIASALGVVLSLFLTVIIYSHYEADLFVGSANQYYTETCFIIFSLIAITLFVPRRSLMIASASGLGWLLLIYYDFPGYFSADYADIPLTRHLYSAFLLAVAVIVIVGCLKKYSFLKFLCLIPFFLMLAYHIMLIKSDLDDLELVKFFASFEDAPEGYFHDHIVYQVIIGNAADFLRSIALFHLALLAAKSDFLQSNSIHYKTLNELVDAFLSGLYDADKWRLEKLICSLYTDKNQRISIARDWIAQFEMQFYISRKTRKEQKIVCTMGNPLFTSDIEAYKDGLLTRYPNHNVEKITRHVTVDIRLVSDHLDFIKREPLEAQLHLDAVREGEYWKVKNTDLFSPDTTYYAVENFQPIDEEAGCEADIIDQVTCQSCGKQYDIDYPRCPFCKAENNL